MPGSFDEAVAGVADGANKVVAAMTHTTSEGKPKIVREITSPITAPACVDLIITDIAAIEGSDQGLLLKEAVPGWTAEDIQALTEAQLRVAPDLREMELL